MSALPQPQPSDPQEEISQKDRIVAINRFISTMAGAFRAFYLYRSDHKILDEIMSNLVKRFDSATSQEEPFLTVGITNRSLTYQGLPVGHEELTVFLASILRNLGFKEISFKRPIRNANFFNLLNILSNKDSNDAKLDKLNAFTGDETDKPISLSLITANSLILRMSDDEIKKRLAPIQTPRAQEGYGFIELMEKSRLQYLPDLFTWICIKSSLLPPALGNFVNDICDATREGYFPINRFLNVFPLSPSVKPYFDKFLSAPVGYRERRRGPLGHRFWPKGRQKTPPPLSWSFHLTAFTEEEINMRKELKYAGAAKSTDQDLNLAYSLLQSTGANFSMGLRILLRILGNKNTVATQEKALKLGIRIWTRHQKMMEDSSLMSLLASLRQNLSSAHNLTIVLYPLRNLTMGSDLFNRIGNFIVSLGEAALPSLIKALEDEQDRAMRKKLLHVTTLNAKESGVDHLIEAMPNASNFLLRNILLILGDVKSIQAIDAIYPCLNHAHHIVRMEAARSLIKIGTDQTKRFLLKALSETKDAEVLNSIFGYFAQIKFSAAVEVMTRMGRDPNLNKSIKRALIDSIGKIGGLQAKQFLQSQIQSGSLFSRMNSDENEIQKLVQYHLDRMKR